MLIVIAALAVTTLVSLKSAVPDKRPVPRALRFFFCLFALLVLVCGIALLFGIPGILPWNLAEPTSLLIGWIFVGLSAEYAYVALRGDGRTHGCCSLGSLFMPQRSQSHWWDTLGLFIRTICQV